MDFMKALETEVAIDDFIRTLKDIMETGLQGESDPETAEVMQGFTETIFPILQVAKMVHMVKVNAAALGFPLDEK